MTMGARVVVIGRFSIVFLALTAPLLLTGCGPSEDSGAPRPKASAGARGADTAVVASAEEAPQRGHDPEYGQMLYGNSCVACHGTRGQGMPHQGVNLRTSKFVSTRTREQLVEFLKKGRAPTDSTSTVKRLMPPRGGNANLDDAGLGDVVAFLRQLQDEAKQEGETEEPTTPDAREAVAQ
jgi:cytochrome c5